MPLSYYKRILFIVLLSYISLIILHKAVSIGDKPLFPNKSNISLNLPLKRAEVEGIVSSYPRASGKRFRFDVAVNKINGEKTKDGIIVYLHKADAANFRDKVLLKGTVGNIFSDKIPGNLDWKEYLEIKGINAKMLNPKVEILKEAGFIFRLSRNIHARILKVFDKEFDRDYSAILSGIVIGEKENIPKSLKRSFQDSGAMHLLVASGSNVGFMAFIVYFICALARMKKGLAYFISIAVCGIYVLSAGLDPPLVRAYIMFMFALAGFLISRQSGVFQGLLISGFVILIYQPNALFDAGFQMSFIATY